MWRQKVLLFLSLLTVLDFILSAVVDSTTHNKVDFNTICGTFNHILPVEVSIAMLFCDKRCNTRVLLGMLLRQRIV